MTNEVSTQNFATSIFDSLLSFKDTLNNIYEIPPVSMSNIKLLTAYVEILNDKRKELQDMIPAGDCLFIVDISDSNDVETEYWFPCIDLDEVFAYISKWSAPHEITTFIGTERGKKAYTIDFHREDSWYWEAL